MGLKEVKERLTIDDKKPEENKQPIVAKKETFYYAVRPLFKGDKGPNWVCVESTPTESPKRPFCAYTTVNAKYKKERLKPEKQKLLLLENLQPDLNEKQKFYKKQVYSLQDIKTRTNDTYIAKKGRGFARYLFVNDFVRCLPGILYYFTPLLTFFVWFVANWFYVDFIENAIVATVAMLLLLPIYKTFVSKEMNLPTKIITIALLILIIVLSLYALVTLEPLSEFYAKIDWMFTLKLFFLIISIYYFTSFYVLFYMCYKQDCSISRQRARVFAGEPGAGKTSRAVQEAYMMAINQWNELKYEFWKLHGIRDKIYASGNKKKILYYKKLEESVRFYNEHPDKIPCLWSTFTIIDYTGRSSYDITLEHIRGLQSLPQYPVILFDELGAVLKNEFSNSKTSWYDVSDFARLIRHYYNGYFYGCEQDHNNIYIDFRRVVGENVLISCTEWVHKPIILYGIFHFLKFLKFDSLDRKIKTQTKYSLFLDNFEKLVKSIGFRKQYYKSLSNVQTGSIVASKNDKFERIINPGSRVRIMPSMLAAGYDDRQYFFDNPSVFDNGIFYEDKRELDTINLEYDRQFVSQTEKIIEKRVAQDNDINNLLNKDWSYDITKNKKTNK